MQNDSVTEWEGAKENIQPLRRGRKVSSLKAAFGGGDDDTTHLNHKRLTQLADERKALQNCIEEYEGDDPLAGWIDLVKWTQENFPGGDGDLISILEDCTKTFTEDPRYKHDIRFLRLWITYADLCVDPSDIFAFLQANDIGQSLALFYEAWAIVLANKGQVSRARRIYLAGIEHRAQPLQRLERHFDLFQQRVAEAAGVSSISAIDWNAVDTANPDSADPENANPGANPNPKRHAFKSLKGTKSAARPIFSQGAGAGGADQQKAPIVAPTGGSTTGNFQIFQDAGGETEKSGPERSAIHWRELATQKALRKENTDAAQKWTEARPITKKADHDPKSVASGVQIFVDESFRASENPERETEKPLSTLRTIEAAAEPAAAAKKKKKSSKSSSSSAKAESSGAKAKKAEKPGYCKEFLCAEEGEGGMEWSIEELQAMRRGRRYADQSFQALVGHVEAVDRRINASKAAAALPQKKPAFPVFEDAENRPAAAPMRSLIPKPKSAAPIAVFEDPKPKSAAPIAVFQDPKPKSAAPIAVFEDPKPKSAAPIAVFEDPKPKAAAPIAVFEDPKPKSAAPIPIFEDAKPQPAAAKATTIDAGKKKPGFFNMFDDECVRKHESAVDKPADAENAKPPRSTVVDAENAIPTAALGSGTGVAENQRRGLRQIVLPVDQDASRLIPSANTSHSVANTTATLHSHHNDDEDDEDDGLVNTTLECRAPSPTMNTKAALRDVESMFCGKLLCEEEEELEEQLNASLAVNPMRQNIRRNDVLGFTVFEDTKENSSAAHGLSCLVSPIATTNTSQSSGNSTLDSYSFGSVLKPQQRSLTNPNPATANPPNHVIHVDQQVNQSEEEEEEKENGTQKKVSMGGRTDSSFTVSPLSMTANTTFALDDDLLDDDVTVTDTLDAVTVANPERLIRPDTEGIVEMPFAREHQWRCLEAAGWTNGSSLPRRCHISTSYTPSPPLSLLLTPSSATPLSATPPVSTPFELAETPGRAAVTVTRRLGGGAYATVWGCVVGREGEREREKESWAMKVEAPANRWEYYVLSQIHRRVPSAQRRHFPRTLSYHEYPNPSNLSSSDRSTTTISALLLERCHYGTLHDALNARRLATGKPGLEETLCLFYAIEMVRVVEILHGVGIVHGDVKPDNWVLRHEESDDGRTQHWQPDHTANGWESKGLKLIDFGRAIDLSLYTNLRAFTGDCHVSGFKCTEMQEGKPWSFHVDYFGIAATAHCMLYGEYLQTTRDSRTGRLRPQQRLKRYWDTDLWSEVFDTLLNPGDQVPIQLNQLRRMMEENLASKPNKTKSLRVLLAKQHEIN